MNNLLKVIKRNNKKKGINITVATMVMFLLSCTGIAAKDISSNFENKDTEVLNEQVNIIAGADINITNSGTISVIAESKEENNRNGIATYLTAKGINIGNIKNSGKI